MPYILDARSQTEELPRLAWLELTGKQDKVRVTFASSTEILARGVGSVEELESFATGSGECLCSDDIWIERTDQRNVWQVSLVSAPHAGPFLLSAYELTCGIQQLQMDRMLSGASVGLMSPPPSADRMDQATMATFQTARGSVYDA